jgi:hypothetical protein
MESYPDTDPEAPNEAVHEVMNPNAPQTPAVPREDLE